MNVALAWLDPEDPTDRAVAAGLGGALRARGHRVVLVGPRAGPRTVAGLPFRRAADARALARLQEAERFDVWHAHLFARDASPLERAARAGRWALLATPHLVLADYLPFVGGARGLRRLLAAARRVTAVSRSARDELAAIDPAAGRRCVVVPNGAPEPARPRGPRPAGRYALCVGRLAPYKGQDLLLMAYAATRARRGGLKLVLCGRDQLRGGLARLARALRLGGDVVMTGGLPPARVAALLAGCELAVLPSRRENLPLALLEAMRAGKPVVASRVGGVPEAARHGREALLARPGDVEGLARALDTLAGSAALRRRLGRAARLRSRAFSWERAARAYERLYRSCSAAATRPRGRSRSTSPRLRGAGTAGSRAA